MPMVKHFQGKIFNPTYGPKLVVKWVYNLSNWWYLVPVRSSIKFHKNEFVWVVLEFFANVSNDVILRTTSTCNFYWLHFQIWVVMFFWISMKNAFQRYVTWHTLEKKIFTLAWKPVLVCKIHKQVPIFWVWDLNPFLTSKLPLCKVLCLYALVHNIYTIRPYGFSTSIFCVHHILTKKSPLLEVTIF